MPELQRADGKSAAEEDETETEHQQASMPSVLVQEQLDQTETEH